MKNLVFPALIAVTLFASAFTTIRAVNWKIAEGYAIKFAGKDAEGSFAKMTGDIAFDESNLNASKFSVVIDANSINTGQIAKFSRSPEYLQESAKQPLNCFFEKS
ncbi:MAG: YceI family protein [Saprospiraceae bacterium]|nr:YceI family protein [Saprospiraceae bacterium]